MGGLRVPGATPAPYRPVGPPGEDGAAAPYHGYDVFADWGIRALTTTRAAGSFGTASPESVATVLGRWDALRQHAAAAGVDRFATVRQVHGAEVVVHVPGWRGWLRGGDADGHISLDGGIATAVSVADCVPVFVAHPRGATALLHSGWRGTEANILAHAVRLLHDAGLAPSDLRLLLGPAICGGCYEVSPDVYGRLTGCCVSGPATVDLRAIIADQARTLGVRAIFAVDTCTRCDNELFFSHRAGDPGRQLGVLYAE